MATNPTGALTFEDLIIEVAIKLGVAYYGAAGDEEAQVPTDVHDLSICKRVVNNAIRLFLSDAPPNGWRCQHPVATLSMWASVAVDSTVTATGVYEPATDTTLITASAATFYDSMELKSIVVTDVDTLTIATYVSTTTVRVAGSHSWTGSKTFSIASNGNYTLPRTFGGEVTGDITYDEDTRPTITIKWVHETRIRRNREDTTSETGYSYWAATRKMNDGGDRWELMAWPVPNTLYVVNFPYELYFDKLVSLTEMHPCGHAHDEGIKAACFAVLERDVEDVVGDLMNYYRQIALPNSHKADGRQAPRRLGSMSRRTPVNQHNFRSQQRRPTVELD